MRIHEGQDHLRAGAEQRLVEILELAPWFTPALTRLSHLRLEAGDLEESLSLFDRANEIAPRHEQVSDLSSRLRQTIPGLTTSVEEIN